MAKIGVLALQGAFREHLDTLAAIGVEGVRVREPRDLDGVSGLILPGGESTTMRQLIERWGLREPILDLAESGAPLFGTCAGMIVLSSQIVGGEAPVLPLLDVTVERNAFGRQLDSFEAELSVPVLGDRPVHAVFIRAPVIERTGSQRRPASRFPAFRYLGGVSSVYRGREAAWGVERSRGRGRRTRDRRVPDRA